MRRPDVLAAVTGLLVGAITLVFATEIAVNVLRLPVHDFSFLFTSTLFLAPVGGFLGASTLLARSVSSRSCRNAKKVCLFVTTIIGALLLWCWSSIKSTEQLMQEGVPYYLLPSLWVMLLLFYGAWLNRQVEAS